jgi:hypothetical protein
MHLPSSSTCKLAQAVKTKTKVNLFRNHAFSLHLFKKLHYLLIIASSLCTLQASHSMCKCLVVQSVMPLQPTLLSTPWVFQVVELECLLCLLIAWNLGILHSRIQLVIKLQLWIYHNSKNSFLTSCIKTRGLISSITTWWGDRLIKN